MRVKYQNRGIEASERLSASPGSKHPLSLTGGQ